MEEINATISEYQPLYHCAFCDYNQIKNHCYLSDWLVTRKLVPLFHVETVTRNYCYHFSQSSDTVPPHKVLQKFYANASFLLSILIAVVYWCIDLYLKYVQAS